MSNIICLLILFIENEEMLQMDNRDGIENEVH